jgi:hypothetical protein
MAVENPEKMDFPVRCGVSATKPETSAAQRRPHRGADELWACAAAWFVQVHAGRLPVEGYVHPEKISNYYSGLALSKNNVLFIIEEMLHSGWQSAGESVGCSLVL